MKISDVIVLYVCAFLLWYSSSVWYGILWTETAERTLRDIFIFSKKCIGSRIGCSFVTPPFSLGHVMNSLRQRLSVCFREEVGGNCRQNSQSPENNVRQVIKIYPCARKRESYGITGRPSSDPDQIIATAAATYWAWTKMAQRRLPPWETGCRSLLLCSWAPLDTPRLHTRTSWTYRPLQQISPASAEQQTDAGGLKDIRNALVRTNIWIIFKSKHLVTMLTTTKSQRATFRFGKSGCVWKEYIRVSMRHTFGYQLNEEQWCCSYEEYTKKANSSAKASQCQPDGNVCRYFQGSRYQTADEGVGMKLWGVQRQTIVGSTDGKPGKTNLISKCTTNSVSVHTETFWLKKLW